MGAAAAGAGVPIGGDDVIATLATQAEREGMEVWLYMLAGVMVLGAGELWMARRWSQEVG